LALNLLIDTCSYSHAQDGETFESDALRSADIIYISPIVIGEIYYANSNGSRTLENNLTLDNFLSNPRVVVLTITVATAKIYGEIKHRLKIKGRPIPINDIWIAASAIEHDISLLTRDSDFNNIEQLKIYKG
jgi:tRNA(fMet)-specific endonuclease VapC